MNLPCSLTIYCVRRSSFAFAWADCISSFVTKTSRQHVRNSGVMLIVSTLRSGSMIVRSGARLARTKCLFAT